MKTHLFKFILITICMTLIASCSNELEDPVIDTPDSLVKNATTDTEYIIPPDPTVGRGPLFDRASEKYFRIGEAEVSREVISSIFIAGEQTANNTKSTTGVSTYSSPGYSEPGYTLYYGSNGWTSRPNPSLSLWGRGILQSVATMYSIPPNTGIFNNATFGVEILSQAEFACLYDHQGMYAELPFVEHENEAEIDDPSLKKNDDLLILVIRPNYSYQQGLWFDPLYDVEYEFGDDYPDLIEISREFTENIIKSLYSGGHIRANAEFLDLITEARLLWPIEGTGVKLNLANDERFPHLEYGAYFFYFLTENYFNDILEGGPPTDPNKKYDILRIDEGL